MSSKERGSALLIVFVFAAIIAIMLYMEMPVAAFEAQRQKEQLLIDRGNEYAHAVKLFVRKMGTYPTSIEQLENTNSMRFLRHRFKDPFTGKDDWRLLHAGPGGVLIDSKVKPPDTNNQNGNGVSGSSNSTFGSTTNSFASSSFGSSSSSTFGSSSSSTFGSSSNSSAGGGDQVVVAPVPQRPPEIAANSAAVSVDASSAGVDPTSLSPISASGQAAQAPATQNSAGAQAGAQPTAQAQPGAQSNGVPVTDPANTTPMLRNLLTNPNSPLPPTPAATPGSSNPTNSPGSPLVINGAIAGVASIAKGHSIKTVNDQTDYSLWEFYYDPTKAGMPGATGMPGTTPAQTTPAANTNASPFGGNAFTQGSPGSTFGQSTPPPTTTPPQSVPPPNPPPQ